MAIGKRTVPAEGKARAQEMTCIFQEQPGRPQRPEQSGLVSRTSARTFLNRRGKSQETINTL